MARPDGSLVEGRAAPGRGAWLCRGSVTCVDAAAGRRAFGRALRTDVTPGAVASLRASVVRRGRMEEEPPGAPARR
ncbi:MAG: DUF448 domain-containing protein [Acidimicrobiales bacterium]